MIDLCLPCRQFTNETFAPYATAHAQLPSLEKGTIEGRKWTWKEARVAVLARNFREELARSDVAGREGRPVGGARCDGDHFQNTQPSRHQESRCLRRSPTPCIIYLALERKSEGSTTFLDTTST